MQITFAIEWKHNVFASGKSWCRLYEWDITLFELVISFIAKAFGNSLIQSARLWKLEAFWTSLLISQNKKRDFVLLNVLSEPKDLIICSSVKVDYFRLIVALLFKLKRLIDRNRLYFLNAARFLIKSRLASIPSSRGFLLLSAKMSFLLDRVIITVLVIILSESKSTIGFMVLHLHEAAFTAWDFDLVEYFLRPLEVKCTWNFILWIPQILEGLVWHANCAKILPNLILLDIRVRHFIIDELLLLIWTKLQQFVVDRIISIQRANQRQYILFFDALQPLCPLMDRVCDLEHHAFLSEICLFKKSEKLLWDTLLGAIFSLIDSGWDHVQEFSMASTFN